MSLNIKNEEAHKLAQALANETGESMAVAVTQALRERLEQVRRLKHKQGLAERLMAIAHETAPRFKEPWKSVEHGDLLYDERGLPK